MNAIDQAGYDSRLLTSKCRTRELADLRKIVINMLYYNTSISVRQLAKQMNMTHGAVVIALQKSKEYFKVDADFRDLVNIIIVNLDRNVPFVSG